MSTSFGEPPDLLSAALKLSTETKALNEVSWGYRVRSDIRRKPNCMKILIFMASNRKRFYCTVVKVDHSADVIYISKCLTLMTTLSWLFWIKSAKKCSHIFSWKQWPYLQHFLWFITYVLALQARVFVPDWLLQPSLVSARKAGAYRVKHISLGKAPGLTPKH